MAEIKKIRLASKLKKENLVVKFKKDSGTREDLEADKKKRLFLKLAGVVGLGAVASLLIPKKAEALVFGSTPASNVVGIKDLDDDRINPATEETLATLATEETLATLATEETLADIKTGTDNLAGIKTATDKLHFTGENLQIVGASGSDVVGIKDASDIRITPVSEENVILLRRMVKLMESQATVDSGNRQRVNIDSLGTVAVTTTVPVSGTVTATVGAATIATIAGQNQQMYQDAARNAFANGIRQNLIFS